MRTAHTFTLDIEVFDPSALWRAAAEHMRREPGCDEGLLAEWIGTEAEPDVKGCLTQLLDPGESPPGTSIQNSSHESIDLD